MVMPNIGAFIAWGLITALFIADGWIPNEGLASIHPYMLTYLLPILIAATGGSLTGGERGRVMGAIAILGCIAGVGGTEGQPMLMAAMAIGPFAGWVIKMFDKFMEDALYEQLTAKTDQAEAAKPADTLTATAPTPEVQAVTPPARKVIDENGILLNQPRVSKEEAIRAAGALLVKQGCVDESYIDAMVEREKLVSTYMGMGLAIPHGTSEAKGSVKKTGIVLVQYPDGVNFGDEDAQLVFGIAGIGDEHLDLLAKICAALEDETVLEKMKATGDVTWILEQLA